MAPRRGVNTTHAPEPENSLRFNEPLSWRAGKSIPVGELLKRLDNLSKELQGLEQDTIEKESLTHVAKELAGQHLLSHKDRGVRAFTACCLVDILKLCAPDAPFTPSQLDDIFRLFVINIIPSLADPTSPYNFQHMYVLTSLAEVKSIVLVTDLPKADDLITFLFTTVFDIISGTSTASTGESIGKNVELHMNSILVTIIDEAPSLPAAVVDVIVAQFLRATAAVTARVKGKNAGGASDDKQSKIHVKEYPAAYKMAQFVCQTCPEKMSRYISQYFNDVILEVSTMTKTSSKGPDHHISSMNDSSSDEDPQDGPSEGDLRELNKAHRLLRELWRACPQVLQNVIPQLEAELSAENLQLRLLATETLGDMISGIGAAGPPPPPVMDSSAYPPLTLEDPQEPTPSSSVLTTPMSPLSFAQAHPSVYHNFLGRAKDKSAMIRSSWVTAIGRVLLTSAGGTGLSREDETMLANSLAEKLMDSDDRVRIASIRAVARFNFRDVMTKLVVNGGVTQENSVLWCLADRARDKRPVVRQEGMTTVSKIWGVASGEMMAGNESVLSALGAIPSRLLVGLYANDREVNAQLDHIQFEQLIPLSYPPLRTRNGKISNGDPTESNGADAIDADKLRTHRILLLVKMLEPKAKTAFFALQARQGGFRSAMTLLVQKCEEYNGGVIQGDQKKVKGQLDSVIKWLAAMLPDAPRATADLYKFAKLHIRRSYTLLKFAMDLGSDFRKVFKSIREFSKLIEAAPGSPGGILETLMPLVYRSSSLIYNQSHLPAILQYSRSDADGLGSTAHEMLKAISEQCPEIFRAQVKSLCKILEEAAPSETQSNDPDAVKTLKACAGYAKKFPDEIPHDRKFVQALLAFAQYAVPPQAAKYAVTILMAASQRREVHASELLDKAITGLTYESGFLATKLAALSQLTLLAPDLTDEKGDELLELTTQQILLVNRTLPTDEDRSWEEDSTLDLECQAKCWALKILANRLRGPLEPASAKILAVPIFKLLNTLIHKEGELSKSEATPKHHRSRLRLLAAQIMLKLCTSSVLNEMLSPSNFDKLATVAQDSIYQVRRGFIDKIQKYLVKERLPHRFYTILFLVAFEPESLFRSTVITWVKSRVNFFHSKQSHVIEAILPRLLSLLAHHPDYSSDPQDLLDTALYILFFVKTVADESNLGLIFRYAQRVKQARDAMNLDESGKLYILSDLAQTVIRKYEDRRGWNMQTYAPKLGLPKDIFTAMADHESAQQVANRNYLPEDMNTLLDDLVKSTEKKKKRKPERDAALPVAKKSRSRASDRNVSKDGLKTRKAGSNKSKPQKQSQSSKTRTSEVAPASSEGRRRSSRGITAKSYADRDDSQDDEEMWNGVSKWEYEDGRVETDEEIDDDSANESVSQA